MALTPTTRARGSNAKAVGAFETTPATAQAGAGFFSIPFVSHTLGEERPLIESDLLGQGREPSDPTPDVATNDGDIVIPVDARNFGRFLKLYFGDPVTTEVDPNFSHVFTSGAAALPSMSIEIGSPEVPAFSTHYGARGNQLRIALSRSGLLNATCSLICVGETATVNATVATGSVAALDTQRFPHATGSVKKDGVELGSVVAADFAYSNSLEKVETIKSDGRIEDSDPGMVMMSGSVTVRFKDKALLNAASTNPPTPIALSFGWTVGAFTLTFSLPRVFLPKPKRPVSGPNGIQAVFNWQASGAGGHTCTVTLVNDVESYA